MLLPGCTKRLVARRPGILPDNVDGTVLLLNDHVHGVVVALARDGEVALIARIPPEAINVRDLRGTGRNTFRLAA